MPDLRELETYFTLQEATDKYGISVEVLTQLVKSGKIKAVRLDGTVAVAEGDVRKRAEEAALRKRFDHLRGRPIRLSEAARKYNLNKMSLWRWARGGYIRVLSPEDRWALELDEADVAYVHALAEAGRLKPGKALFGEESPGTMVG